MNITPVLVDQIEPENNDRKVFDEGALEGLAASIMEVGLLQPIRVRRHPDDPDRFLLIAGERRWRAHLRLERSIIDAIVVDENDEVASAAMLAENTGRVDLNVIEEARAYRRRVDEFGASVEDVAQVAGRSPAHVRWRLGLLTLSPEIVEQVAAGQLRHTTAELLVGLDTNRQRAALAAIAKSDLSWDEQKALCVRLRTEQAEEPLFDLDGFGLNQEEYVARAREENPALTPTQMARLADEVLAALLPSTDLLPPELEVKVQRLQRAIDYKLKRKEPA